MCSAASKSWCTVNAVTSCLSPMAEGCGARKRSHTRTASGQWFLVLGTYISHAFLFPVATVSWINHKGFVLRDGRALGHHWCLWDCCQQPDLCRLLGAGPCRNAWACRRKRLSLLPAVQQQQVLLWLSFRQLRVFTCRSSLWGRVSSLTEVLHGNREC